jgi:hypothetical protein
MSAQVSHIDEIQVLRGHRPTTGIIRKSIYDTIKMKSQILVNSM